MHTIEHAAPDRQIDAQPAQAPTTATEGLIAARASGIGAVVLTGAIFGFFYAWVCSTMWGLDDADPRVAIEAMQAMNASVRNGVFFPAFFLTPVALGLGALLMRRCGAQTSARYFGAAGLVYLLGGLVLTMAINVPMNEDLAAISVPASRADASVIWEDYSGRWQVWNIVRTVASGVALTLAAIGLVKLPKRSADAPGRPSRECR